jgi:hypothetical protein
MQSKQAPETDLLKFFSTVKEGLTGAYGLARALPAFFRETITVQQAEDEIRKALERREEIFLELARARIYGNPSSPYLKLLEIAGCELSDLQAQVHRHGLEQTLERLAGEGVYLTSDEFKGKNEVIRGGKSFRVLPGSFEPPDASPGFVLQTSGTTNKPVRSFMSLDWLRLRALAAAIYFSAHDLFSCSHAMYDAILPGAGGVNNLLIFAKLGVGADRWFARQIPVDNWLHGRYHYLITYLIVLLAKWFGPGFPRPDFIDIEDVHRIVHWVSEKRHAGIPCCITTAASNAARLARVAEELGTSLAGVKFNVSGEPLTDAKCEAIKQAGAAVTLRYSFGAGTTVGYGCGRPVYTDEIHVNTHMLALAPHPRSLAVADTLVHPVLFTTLYSSAPSLLLNVENGDYAMFLRRDCGCALEKAGLTLHLHHIRSYEKFTSEGMNYFYGDLFEFFEKTLPSEFGGGPGDYQLVEEEDGTGQTRLTLVVRPDVGALDDAKILLRLQQRLAEGSSANRFQAGVWEKAGTLRLVRQAPHASPRGKILPLHIRQDPAGNDG